MRERGGVNVWIVTDESVMTLFVYMLLCPLQSNVLNCYLAHSSPHLHDP